MRIIRGVIEVERRAIKRGNRGRGSSVVIRGVDEIR